MALVRCQARLQQHLSLSCYLALDPRCRVFEKDISPSLKLIQALTTISQSKWPQVLTNQSQKYTLLGQTTMQPTSNQLRIFLVSIMNYYVQQDKKNYLALNGGNPERS